MFGIGYYKTLAMFDTLVNEPREKMIEIGKILNRVDEDIINAACRRAILCTCVSGRNAKYLFKQICLRVFAKKNYHARRW
jgi:hypothetical protein